MSDDRDREDVVQELTQVDEQLSQLRALRAPGPAGPEDNADAASDLTSQAEQEALVANLEARRESLSTRLADTAEHRQ